MEAKRAIIIIGYKCNNNCLFCSVGDRDKAFSRQFVDIVEELYEKKAAGVLELELIGGEALIRKDIVSLVEAAKGFGYERILVETNGRMLSIEDFARKVISSGLNTISFSLHGHNANIHDELTGVPGSFDQCLLGIANAKRYGAEVRVNHVLCKPNYKYVSNFLDLAAGFRPDKLSLSFINPIASAKVNREQLVPRLKQVSGYVAKALEKKLDFDLWLYNLPFCVLPEHEDKIRTLKKMIDTLMSDGKSGEVDLKTNIRKLKIKPEKCSKCRRKKECDGIWKGYYDIYGDQDLKPVL